MELILLPILFKINITDAARQRAIWLTFSGSMSITPTRSHQLCLCNGVTTKFAKSAHKTLFHLKYPGNLLACFFPLVLPNFTWNFATKCHTFTSRLVFIMWYTSQELQYILIKITWMRQQSFIFFLVYSNYMPKAFPYFV